MKIAINRCFGGFILPDHIYAQLIEKVPEFKKLDFYEKELRASPVLISLIENEGKIIEDQITKIVIVSIPDEATDWEITEYDGYESVTYVVNGKLKHV